jgi:DNA-binding FrmR family transcriptional regulator
MRVDHYIHLAADGTTRAQLNEALTLLRGLNRKQEKIMATQQEILDQLAAVNTSLDGIQADITDLKALVDSGADLTAISDAVNALAAKASGIDLQTP